MKISPEEYAKWAAEFFQGLHEKIRFGQAFCNHFNITDPDLFYEEEFHEAVNKVFDRYVGE